MTRVDQIFLRVSLAAVVVAAASSVSFAQGARGGGGRGGRGGGDEGRGPSTYIVNARVLTMTGQDLDNATIQMSGSNIRRIGTDIRVPDGATVVDARGLTVTPGLIDADGALAVSFASRGGGGGATSRAWDAFDRYALPLFKDAVRNGVTAVSISPRTGAGITGTSAVVRLQPGADGPWAGAVIKEDAALCIDLNSNAAPTARLATLDEVRRQFKAARDYREARETYQEDLEAYEKKIKERAEKEKGKGEGKDGQGGDKPGEGGGRGSAMQPQPGRDGPAPGGGGGGGSGGGDRGGAGQKEEDIKKPTEPPVDRKAEILLRAIDGEIPVRVRSDRSEDIFNALDLATEFSLKLIIDGGTEAHLVARQIAAAEASVVLGPALGRGFFVNDAYQRRAVGGIDALEKAGVECVVGSGRGGSVDGGLGDPSASRFVLANAQLVAQQSNRTLDPLKMVTADAAEFLGVADRIGRLRPGMAADIVLWSGDPLDPSARVREVYIGGELVYRSEDASGGGANQ